MDAGIIRAVKAYYRRQLVKKWVEDVTQHRELSQPDVLQAIQDISRVWNTEMVPRTISHCFKATGIVPIMRATDLGAISDPGVPTKTFKPTLDDLAAEIIKDLVKSVPGLENKMVDDLIVGNAVVVVKIKTSFADGNDTRMR